MPASIRRVDLSTALGTALRRSPAVALVGPRQVGKTTLAREHLEPSSPNYFDLENPVDLERRVKSIASLSPLRGLAVIDEIQRRPDLFPVLRVLIDRAGQPARFLIYFSCCLSDSIKKRRPAAKRRARPREANRREQCVRVRVDIVIG